MTITRFECPECEHEWSGLPNAAGHAWETCPGCGGDDGENCWDCGVSMEEFLCDGLLCTRCRHTLCEDCTRSHHGDGRDGRLGCGGTERTL